ncbi:uncharacterized protein si:dkey-195m11.11 [Puntigrus tetrazona]|uniref:uncharacterized protein si:dkey-195m11.11 n=1 Tax=Puntigrus tetrazona TaxID=1606681 RepID=UPI001C8A974F|nr:uncharacterized protein si:dkey-195m11.11 [Puntigrus tetrazona]
MIIHNTGVLSVVCWLMHVRETVSQAYAPAPTLRYDFGEKENNELNYIVNVVCATPRSASYPVTVSVGKLESPSQTPETTEAWVTSNVVKQAESTYFTIPATAKFEGKIVCWYKSTQTDSKNPYSALSNNITLVVSSLTSPTVTVHPNVFMIGQNYTVQCDSAYSLPNITLSLYYRPVTPGSNWTLVGSLFLTNNTSIILRQTNAVEPVEFACSMEMMYNGKVLHSSLSKSEQAIPEKFLVRLWEQSRGESCLGFLDVTIKGKWEPVCQKEVDTDADSSSAAATAEVVCRQLGCGSVLKWDRLWDDKRLFATTVGGIRCSGKEKKIMDCPVKEIGDCKQRGMLYIICSDALPRPELSVDMSVSPNSRMYVTDKQDVKISCSTYSTYLKSVDYGYTVLKKDGVHVTETYSKPGSTVSFTQHAPVPEGEYECFFHLTSSKIKLSQPSNSVFIYIYNPPDPVPIVAGVLTTAFGLAILVYICIFRTATEEVQANEFPQTNTENPDNNASYPPQQLEGKEV